MGKILFLNIRGCISFQVSYSVSQFICNENDLNSNTEWSQRHNLYQTVITQVLNNKPFVKSNLLTYKSHNTISIQKYFIRNNVGMSCPPNTLRPLPRSPTPAGQYLWQNETIQWLLLPSSLPSPTVSYRDCRVLMHSAECKIVHGRASCKS